MSLIHATPVSWVEFMAKFPQGDGIIPTGKNAEVYFQTLEEEVDGILAQQQTPTPPNRPVLLAQLVKAYIRNINFGDLYNNGSLDLDSIGEFTAGKKRILFDLQPVFIAYGDKDYGFVAESMINSLNERLFNLYTRAKFQAKEQAQARTAVLSEKLFTTLINTAVDTKSRDAARVLKRNFDQWHRPLAEKANEVSLRIFRAKILDDGAQPGDRTNVIEAFKDVPTPIVAEWLQLEEGFLTPITALDEKATNLRTPKHPDEWSALYDTVNSWIKDVQEKRPPERPRPGSLVIDTRFRLDDGNSTELVTPVSTTQDNDGIPFMYFASGFSLEQLADLAASNEKPDFFLPSAASLVKSYVLDKLLKQREIFLGTIAAICGGKNPLAEEAAALGVVFDALPAGITDPQKKYAQKVVVPYVENAILKAVAGAFQSQKTHTLQELSEELNNKLKNKGDVLLIEELTRTLLTARGQIMDAVASVKTLDQLKDWARISQHFEDKILTPLFEIVMKSDTLSDVVVQRQTRRASEFQNEFSLGK